MRASLTLITSRPRFENPLCAQTDPEIFFPEEDEDGKPLARNATSYAEAKAVCRACDHRDACAVWAIKNESQGFWGGLSPAQRRQIRRRFNIKLENPY